MSAVDDRDAARPMGVVHEGRVMRVGRGYSMERGTIRRFAGRLLRFAMAAAIAAATATLLGGGALGAQAAAVGAASAGGAPVSGRAIPGWPGSPRAYEGRYRLVASSDDSFARSGALTVFTRIVPHQTKPRLSGVLSLYTTDGTNVLYLSHFVHAGTTRSAQVSLGIYTGPEIGRFVVVSRHGAALAATFVPLQGAPVSLRFVQFSTSPHP